MSRRSRIATQSSEHELYDEINILSFVRDNPAGELAVSALKIVSIFDGKTFLGKLALEAAIDSEVNDCRHHWVRQDRCSR